VIITSKTLKLKNIVEKIADDFCLRLPWFSAQGLSVMLLLLKDPFHLTHVISLFFLIKHNLRQ
jgi:hypothetical protein